MTEKNKKVLWGVLLAVIVGVLAFIVCGKKELSEEEFILNAQEMGYSFQYPYRYVWDLKNPDMRVIYTGEKMVGGTNYHMRYEVWGEKEMADVWFQQLIGFTEAALELTGGEVEVVTQKDKKFVAWCTDNDSEKGRTYAILYQDGNNIFDLWVPESDVDKVEKILKGTGY